MASAMALSLTLKGRATPRPPAAKLPRVSPLAGIRAKQ